MTSRTEVDRSMEPPFVKDDRVVYTDGSNIRAGEIVVDSCERRVCHGVIKWVVTDDAGGRHYADRLKRLGGTAG